MKPAKAPTSGPYSTAKTARIAYWMLRDVLGIGVGIAAKRPRTKKRAAPTPMATTWVTGE